MKDYRERTCVFVECFVCVCVGERKNSNNQKIINSRWWIWVLAEEILCGQLSLHALNSIIYKFLKMVLEKAMAPHSSTLAWKIPWTEEPGRLQSMGSWRVGHDWATSRSLFTFTHWRRKRQPTPVFLPGESQGQRRLVGCRLWGCTE